MKNKLVAGVGLTALAVMLGAAGMLTNGLPELKAAGAYTNLEPGQLSTGAPNCCGPLVAVDTNRQGGASPQSVAATPFQIAATLLEGLSTPLVSTAGAATGTTLGGVITTETLATAAGATYTFTLTHAGITAAYATAKHTPMVGIYSVTNTGGTIPDRLTAQLTLVSATIPAAGGSVVWVWKNDGTTALNGTMRIGWHL
jgi:hypothetical protein